MEKKLNTYAFLSQSLDGITCYGYLWLHGV